MGIDILTAKSGYEAIRVVGEERPDLILLDGLLPEMHGFEIARFIRRMDADYRPYIAIMTAIYKHTRYQNEARLKYGIDDYLIKPVLRETLTGLARRTQAARRAEAQRTRLEFEHSSELRTGERAAGEAILLINQPFRRVAPVAAPLD
jgi:DNA-binding response OmpR family regulator